MEQQQIEYFEKVLTERKKQLEENLERTIENGMFGKSQLESTSELSAYDNHMGDLASETYEIEKDFAIVQHEKLLIQQVNDALRKIKNGTYGQCDFCGEEIAAERLEFVPEAHLCMDCATHHKAPLESRLDRPVEEKVLEEIHGDYFGQIYPNVYENIEMDQMDILTQLEAYGSSDTMQDIPGVNTYGDLDELYSARTGDVEDTDKISNEEYKNQLS